MATPPYSLEAHANMLRDFVRKGVSYKIVDASYVPEVKSWVCAFGFGIGTEGKMLTTAAKSEAQALREMLDLAVALLHHELKRNADV